MDFWTKGTVWLAQVSQNWVLRGERWLNPQQGLTEGLESWDGTATSQPNSLVKGRMSYCKRSSLSS